MRFQIKLNLYKCQKYFVFGFLIILINIYFIKNIPKYYTIRNKVYNYYGNTRYNITYVNNKLLWNNKTDIGQKKIKEEIKEFRNIELSFNNKVDFIKREKPLISLVITLYNQENYIKNIYFSIQKQSLKELEIIFVDDDSIDNSKNVINYLMGKDNRIVYLKNNINRKTFYSRNLGILNASGKYILVIDPDDLLVNDILVKAYQTAEQYNLDIVQFYVIRGYNLQEQHLWSKVKYKDGILKGNQEIRKIFYYGISRNLWDKLVKREIYLKSIRFMRKEFYDGDYIANDDDTAFFGLVHIAESYGFLEQIGYFYILKPLNTELRKRKINLTNEIFHSICDIMKYFYIQSDDNIIEKRNICFKYFKKSMNTFWNLIKYITKGFDYIINILNLYWNSTYFDNTQKRIINRFKLKIIQRKKLVN